MTEVQLPDRCVHMVCGGGAGVCFTATLLSLSDKSFTHLNSFGQIPLVSKLTL